MSPRPRAWLWVGAVLASAFSSVRSAAEAPPTILPQGQPPAAVADPAPLPTDEEILGEPRWRVEGLRLRAAFYDQYGRGYQSQAGPRLGPGSERLTVIQAMAQLEVRQNAKLTHTLTVPVDAVTMASSNAIDAIANASRQVEAGSIDITSRYKPDALNEYELRYGIHIEQPFRSWNAGLAYRRSLAEDNAQLAVGINQTIDWFDHLSYQGGDHGRSARSTTSLNVALSQLLSETAVAQLSYGYTLQLGELGNTWSSVPLAGGTVGPEVLPRSRNRHALVGRVNQWLPWRGALKLLYRFYGDTFGIVSHTWETQVYQYLSRYLYVRGTYRFYRQSGADFFAIRFLPDGGLVDARPRSPRDPLRTADSDLAPFDAHLVGAKLVVSLAAWQPLGWTRPEISVGYERYARTNDLVVNVYSSGVSFRF